MLAPRKVCDWTMVVGERHCWKWKMMRRCICAFTILIIPIYPLKQGGWKRRFIFGSFQTTWPHLFISGIVLMHPETNKPLHRIENGYVLWRKETPKIDLGIVFFDWRPHALEVAVESKCLPLTSTGLMDWDLFHVWKGKHVTFSSITMAWHTYEHGFISH